jgi:3-phenylpropionate/trans-cinnamate dioxygenase ferredoxin reductase component
MEHRKYLIIGGGLAADSAVRGIRELDQDGSILVVSDDDHPPYDRPPLSKGLWKGTAVDTIWRHTELANAELRLGTRVVALNRSCRTATDADGTVVTYGKLLLATGGSPRPLRRADPSVIYFRKFSDFQQTRQAANEGAEFAVIGGGFIGSEVAAALAMNGSKVSLIFPGDSIGEQLYPRPLAHFLNLYFRKRGVDVRFNERVRRVERVANKLAVHVNNDSRVVVDMVIAGIGIEPNVDLAKAAELQIGDGIVVDEMLRTSDPNIFAAGDVANFPCAALERRLRYEHEDNAQAMGRTAGRNMAGGREAYRHLPFFYSDLFDLGYEAVGAIDTRMETVEDWEEKFRRGVIYYVKNRRVLGVLLWNTRGLVDAARELIASVHGQAPSSLIGRLRESA